MGAVKWIGKAFKLVGDILTAEEFEKWLEKQGSKLVEERLKKTSLRMFFGKSRAKKAILLDAKRALTEQGSEAFRTALQHALARLPGLLAQLAKQIEQQDIKDLFVRKGLDRVVAVPRDWVVQEFQEIIVGHFENAAELKDFPGLITHALETTAANAEQAFFEKEATKAGTPLALNYETLGTDPQYRWKSPSVMGHYYLGCDYLKDQHETFKDELTKEITKLIIIIGSLTKDEHAAIIAKLGY